MSLLFSHLVMSNSLWPLGLQHVRIPYPSLSLRVCSNSCSLSQWCHSIILSPVTPFSSCHQSFPASGSFPVSQFCIRWPKYWRFSFSNSPSNEYLGLISFRIDRFDVAAHGTLKSSPAPQFESIDSLVLSLLYDPTLTSIHVYMALTRQTFVSKVMSLLFNTLSRNELKNEQMYVFTDITQNT